MDPDASSPPPQSLTDACSSSSSSSATIEENTHTLPACRMDRHEKIESEAALFHRASLSALGSTVYDDPAVIRVIEHAKARGTSQEPGPTATNRRHRGTQHKAHDQLSRRMTVDTTGATLHHLQQQCQRQQLIDPFCCSLHQGPSSCQDRFWDMLASRMDHEIETRLRPLLHNSVLHPDHHQHHDRVLPGRDVTIQRLDDLERTTERLHKRLTALESNACIARGLSTPTDAGNRKGAQHDTRECTRACIVDNTHRPSDAPRSLQAERDMIKSTMDELKHTLQQRQQRVTDGSGSKIQALQKECQSLQMRVLDEQSKYKQLEQDYVDFHKQKTEDMMQINQMRRRIQALEAELRAKHTRANSPPCYKPNHNAVSKQQKRSYPRPPSAPVIEPPQQLHNRNHSYNNPQNHQNQQQKLQQQQFQHHPQRQHRQVYPYQNQHHPDQAPQVSKLPTPCSSPSLSYQEPRTEHPSKQQPQSSVKEEDGYLVFNTNIDGELIHCRVKIPSSTVTSLHSTPVMRRPADFPLALVSPPITRAGSPHMHYFHRHQHQSHRPHHHGNKQHRHAQDSSEPSNKKGLNPNAPEWRNGVWKMAVSS
ncbi:hypothetical protein BCR43DRAFT_509681 [Syncephalastrum racemosum]|uniref:Uncharacterized protein n=1 Tax=Syncephalastrum racemosum TaxID=13706 RepID=A0A1X2HSH4_SYNRA|nr:hypothetical protein BCR43DRAFT_509681 [Syncephalastrum racemosum]